MILLFLIHFKSVSQQTDSIMDYSISAKYGYGYTYAHHSSFFYLIKNYIQTYEVDFNYRTKGNKLWHKLYHYPTVGFGYHHASLSNPQILGNANTLFTFISAPILETKNLKFSYKSSAGVAYLSKKFDLYNKNYNIAIGTNINAYLNLNLDFDIRVFDKVHALFGFGIFHYSNGGLQQPNRGLNNIYLQTGILYKLNKEESIPKIDSLPKIKKYNLFSIIYAIGFKGLEPAREKKYMVSSFSLNAERQIGHKSRIGIGLDLFKDNSRQEYLKIEGIENPGTTDLFYAGSHLSYDLVFGKTSFTIQMGVYAWQKAKHFQTSYHRFGVKYHFSKHFMANLTLKTYWAAADFSEWGIGYRF